MTKFLSISGLQTFWDDVAQMASDKVANIQTMSATIKGGAKLGSGLRVDGDALSIGNLVHSGSGAEVATDGCAIYSVEGNGWSEQDGTPTPENPVEIKVTRGRNLLNPSSLVPNAYYDINNRGTDSSSASNAYVDIPINSNEEYVLSWNTSTISSQNNRGIGFYDSSNTLVGSTQLTPSGKIKTITTPSDATHICFTVDKGMVDIQLELGSTPTPYAPYGHVGLEVQGRNLLESYQNSTSSTQWVDAMFAQADLKPDTDYVISFVGANGHKAYLNENIFTETVHFICDGSRQSVIGHTVSSIDRSETAQYTSNYGWRIFKNNGNNLVVPGFTDIQLELGSTATPYQPYVHTTTPIPLPLKSDGERWAGGLSDGAADALSIDSAGKWEWTGAADEVVFDGSSDEPWVAVNSGKRVQIVDSGKPPKRTTSAATISAGYCTHFQAITPSNTWDGNLGFAINDTSDAFLFADGTGAMTTASWKSWLSDNPTTVLYQLATPTTEHGYIDLPALPKGATVSIPELEQIGVSWFVQGVDELAKHAANWGKRNQEMESRLATLEAAVAELATA